MRARRTTSGEAARRHHEWLELLTTSGPFLTLPAVHRAFPDGLPAIPTDDRARVRALTAEMLEDRGASRHQVVATLLRDVLGWGDRLLLDDQVPASLAEPVVEHGLTLRPDLAFVSPDTDTDTDTDTEDDAAPGGYRMLGIVSPWARHPLTRTTDGGWTASPVERLAVLLRARDVPVGVVTDGRWWAVVWAPRGGTTGVAVWDAALFSEEPDSLRAFVALLRRSRFLAVAATDTLPALLTESLGAQEEVTVTLGRQVRDAVELLVRTLDELDADSGGELLDGVDDDELYAGTVTMMMRIVFLLFAEDRRLLPSDDALYVAGYGVSSLVDQLEGEARLAGEQALEHRTGAWHRLLATTRALHGGVHHEDLRLPAYGGSLFDPAAYPWLESADRVGDRTVLRVLRAVQYVEIDRERRRLSFRALDVEQIGYVYEGLLETEVRTADEVTLGLARPRDWPRGKETSEVPLSQVQAWLDDAPPSLAERLKPRTGKSTGALEKALARAIEDHERQAVRRVLGHGSSDVDAVTSLAPVLHWFDGGEPAVTMPGRRYVAPGTRRASTGTHYTPRSLAEEVAEGALEPLVYRPGPLETADRSQWRLRPSTAIQALKVADIAMGSGAFLVAACRYLADRLVEAWQAEGRHDALRLAAARAGAQATRDADAEVDHVVLGARRVIAERCLYGVDINPLAVEMAKLSLWLVTMDSTRPFGFLDDRLVAGDSLLGAVDVAQLETLHIDPTAGRALQRGELSYANEWLSRLNRAADLRRQITASPATTVRDIDHKTRLLAEAERETDHVSAVADRLTGVGLRVAGERARSVDTAFVALQIEVGLDAVPAGHLRSAASTDLQRGLPAGKDERKPLHWPVAFPEVLVDPPDRGFDAIIGNPPFLGGKKISRPLGDDYLAWLQRWDGNGLKGNTDLAARFVLRANKLLNARGQLGFIATNTIVQGDTLEVGLAQVTARGLTVRAGRSSRPWPSASASLEIVNIWASRAALSATSHRSLDGEDVPSIGADLEPVGRIVGRPERLQENEGVAFIGALPAGTGFVVTEQRAREFMAHNADAANVLRPYVIGQDLAQRPDVSGSRWIVNFHDWPLDRARNYPDVLALVERFVKPQRDLLPDYKKRVRDAWWRYEHQAPGLYRATADLERMLALARVSNSVACVSVPTGPVYSEKCVVFATASWADLSTLSSSAHFVWVVRYTSTMRMDINYAPSDVFLTLPRPQSTPELAKLGERLDTERRELMLGRAWGLTTTYNAVHNPAVTDPEIVNLREIHEAIDHAVLDAYGWSDLDPQIGYHPTKIGTRWTVSREAHFELLDRLLEENHRRHALEHPPR